MTAGHGLAGHGLAADLPAAEVLGQMEAAVVVIDRIGSIRYANPYAGRLFGITGELAGRSFFSLGFEEGDLGQDGRAAPAGPSRQHLGGHADRHPLR